MCKYCKAQIKDPKAKNCPKCGKQLATPAQTVVTLVVLAAIVFFGIKFMLSLFSTSPATTDTTTPASTTNGSPTPTTDPCAQYLGTPQMVDCMKSQDALEKGQATRYPLKAKVTFDNTALYITNQETTEWDQCNAVVNETDPQGDNFQSDGFVVNAGQTESIGWGNFANAEQQRFNNYQTKPATITLDCVVGGTTDPKTGAFSGGQEHRSTFNLQ
ncbi:MAG TPA: hypothetical protein VGT05_01590 [Patescibacteria group bacterium]|nr:hypothetical protein [Patescibacteria group bacterium]